jgi:hypothetical protein
MFWCNRNLWVKHPWLWLFFCRSFFALFSLANVLSVLLWYFWLSLWYRDVQKVFEITPKVPHLKKITWWQRHATPWERRLFLDSVHWQIASTFWIFKKNQYVSAILMDLSKAFDCLPHDILLDKLSAYGMSRFAMRQKEEIRI